MGTGNGNGYDERPVDYVRAERGSSVLIQADRGIGKQFLAIMWFGPLVGALAAFLAIGAAYWATLAEREARVAQDKLQHYEILLVEKGVIEAGEVH